MRIEAYKRPVDVIVGGKVESKTVMLREMAVGSYSRFMAAQHDLKADEPDPASADNVLLAVFECVLNTDLTIAFSNADVLDNLTRSQVLDIYTAVLEMNFGQPD